MANLNSVAEGLSAPIEEEDFAFFGKYPRGQSEMETPLEAVRGIDRPIPGRGLGKKYAEKYFHLKPKRAPKKWCGTFLPPCETTFLVEPVDERRNQRAGDGQNRHLQSQGWLSR